MSVSGKKTPTVSPDEGATVPKELESEWSQFLKQRKEDKEYDEMVSYFNKQASEMEVPTMDPLFQIAMYVKRIQEEVRVLDEYIQQVKGADRKGQNKPPFPFPVQTYSLGPFRPFLCARTSVAYMYDLCYKCLGFILNISHKSVADSPSFVEWWASRWLL